MPEGLFSLPELDHLGLYLDGDLSETVSNLVNVFGLDRTVFEGEDLTGADLSGGQDFRRFSFRGSRMSSASLRGSNFNGADFENASLSGADLSNGSFQRCNFQGANLQGATLDGADLTLARGAPRSLDGVSVDGIRGSPSWQYSSPGAALFGDQSTVAKLAVFAGTGLHTGANVRVSVRPAPANTGIVFVRIDVTDRDNRVPVSAEAVCKTQLGTVITNAANVTVATIEHLMAALVMLNIDNAIVEVDGPEIPIMDGSAQPFIEILDRAGRRGQDAPRRYIEILETIEVVEGDKRATLSPAGRFEVAFEIAFDSQAIGRQRVDLPMDERAFRSELANCRTFGFLHEVEALRAMGLARGGSMENVVVIEGDLILNPEGLRRPDEFVRHKALASIGDLYVLGAPILGRFEGFLSGHGLVNVLTRTLLSRPLSWRYIGDSEEARAYA